MIPKALKKHLFTVDDHVNTDSTFLIHRVKLSGDNIIVSYILTPEVVDSFKNINLLTVQLFDKNGRTRKVFDFDVTYDRIESFECDWEDNSFIHLEIKFSVLGRKAH